MTLEYPDRNVHPVIPSEYFRNGKPGHAKQFRSLCRAVNTMLARSRVIIPPMSFGVSSGMAHHTYTSETCIARAVYPASLYGSKLGCRYTLHPTKSTYEAYEPYVFLKIDGAAATPIGKSSYKCTHNVR